MANTTNFSIEKASVGGARNSWGGINNVGIDKIDELLALAMPLGTIQMYPLATAPVSTANGGTWLICNGGTLVRTDYQDLYNLIGSTYGTEPSGTTFLLPDLRARVPVGYNVAAIGSGVTVRSIRAMAATAGGTEGHVITEAELAAHSHAIPATTHDHDIGDGTGNDVTHAHVGQASDSGKTGSASTSITIANHTHKSFGSDGYVVDPWHNSPNTHISMGSGIDGDHYGAFKEGTQLVTGPGVTTVTDPGHQHSFTTDSVGHGITTTEHEVIGITETAPDTGSNTSHNNMQPYITVQYIILAKHPSF